MKARLLPRIACGWSPHDLNQIVAAGQKLEAATLVKALKLYLEKRLDVYWGVVEEV